MRRSTRGIVLLALSLALAACGAGEASDSRDADQGPRCVALPCPDAGVPASGRDASASDAGAPAADAGSSEVDASSPRPDAGGVAPDAGWMPLGDCASAPLMTAGHTVHYFCECAPGASATCVDNQGDDSWDGLSPDHSLGGTHGPKRTLATAEQVFNSMAAGDTIALCRGGAFGTAASHFAGFGLNNLDCSGTADETACHWRDYVPPGEAARPIMNLGRDNGFNMYFHDTPQHHQNYRFWNLDLVHDVATLGGPVDYAGGTTFLILGDAGQFYENIDICNVRGRYGSSFLEVDLQRDVTVRYSQVERYATWFQAIGGGGPNFVIDHSTFLNNGNDDNRFCPAEIQCNAQHVVYLNCAPQSLGERSATTGCEPCTREGNNAGACRIGTSEPCDFCTGIRFTNNLVQQDPLGAWEGDPSASCQGIQIVVRGQTEGARIENNLFVLGGGSPTPAPGKVNPKVCAAIGPTASYAYAEHHGLAIRRNRAVYTSHSSNEAALIVNSCKDCFVEDNVIDVPAGGAIGIAAPATGGEGTNSQTTGTVIRNNTVRMGGVGGVGIAVRSGGDGYLIQDNAVWQAAGACLDVTMPATVDHNYCRDETANTDVASTALWVDAENPAALARNFTPVSTGPLVGAGNGASYSATAIGTWQWSPDDAGRARAAPVDLGALHH